MATSGNGSTTSPASREEKGRAGAAMLTQGRLRATLAPGEQPPSQASSPSPGVWSGERGSEGQALQVLSAIDGLAVGSLATEAGELVGRKSRR